MSNELTREQVEEIGRRAELCAEATLPGDQVRVLTALALKGFELSRCHAPQLTREQFWACCDDQKYGDAQWTHREKVWEQIENERLVLRASRDAERERAEHAEELAKERLKVTIRQSVIINEQRQQFADLAARLEAMTQERGELNSALSQYDKRNGELVEELRIRERQLSASEQRVDVLQQTISDHVESYSRLEQRQITTQQQLAEAQDTIARLVGDRGAFRLERDQLQAKIDILAEQANENGSYIQTLLQECHEYKATVTAQAEEIRRLRGELNIESLVNRFLSWPLPNSVCSDVCATQQGTQHRSGTTLLSATEAKQMLEHVLARALATKETP